MVLVRMAQDKHDMSRHNKLPSARIPYDICGLPCSITKKNCPIEILMICPRAPLGELLPTLLVPELLSTLFIWPRTITKRMTPAPVVHHVRGQRADVHPECGLGHGSIQAGERRQELIYRPHPLLPSRAWIGITSLDGPHSSCSDGGGHLRKINTSFAWMQGLRKK